jgi:hypothetical protein
VVSGIRNAADASQARRYRRTVIAASFFFDGLNFRSPLLPLSCWLWLLRIAANAYRCRHRSIDGRVNAVSRESAADRSGSSAADAAGMRTYRQT